MYLKPKDIERFWEKVDIKGENDCWLWIAGKFTRGYGSFTMPDRKYGAHVIAFIIANGHSPNKEVVMHICDTPLCCNPKHLVDATQVENVQDCIKKGRAKYNPLKGQNQPRSKLTEIQVLEIREIHKTKSMTLEQIGIKYGISLVMVHYIVKRKNWTHI